MNYKSNVRGNASYWLSVKGSLQNIIEQKGSPNIFFTFSSAESYWTDMLRLFSSNLPDTWFDKMQSIQKNTSLIDWYFMERFTHFIKILFKDIYPSEWHWFRIEFQHRGTIHIHGFARVKLDIDLEFHVKKAIEYNNLSKLENLSDSSINYWGNIEKTLINTIDRYITSKWPNSLHDIHN